jgi:ankyrin repeat protein
MNNNLRFFQNQLGRLFSAAQSNSNATSFAATTLVCLVNNQDWVNVLKRLKSHPQEATVQDEATGNTVLHLACKLNPPVDVIQALSCNEGIVRRPNNMGVTALHYAASYRCSKEALQALLDAARSDDAGDDKHNSATADLTHRGRAPIHYACMSFRGLDKEALHLLVDATLKEGNIWVHRLLKHQRRQDSVLFMEEMAEETPEDLENDEVELPSNFSHSPDDLTCDDDSSLNEAPVLVNVMGLKDATGSTPLDLLFHRYRERVRCIINTVDRINHQNQDNPDRAALIAAIKVYADLGEVWEKAQWIIARLNEERLQRECEDDANMADVAPRQPQDATSRRTTYYGANCSFGVYDPAQEPCSPGELAVSRVAAEVAMERHKDLMVADDIIMDESHVPDNDRPTPMKKKFRVVHASVGLIGFGCPPELIRLAISIHPHQVTEMDEDGNLPLHIAATAASYLATAHATVSDSDDIPTSIMAAAAAAAQETGDDRSVLSDAAMSFFSSASVSLTTNPFDKVIKMLLDHYPDAARTPHGKTGRLPLVMAIESGRRTWNDGIRTLLNAYPPALHSKKLMDPALYPRVLSKLANAGPTPGVVADKKSKRSIRQESCSRSTLYTLIRSKPEWLVRDFD